MKGRVRGEASAERSRRRATDDAAQRTLVVRTVVPHDYDEMSNRAGMRWWQWLGPGFVVAATGVGAGDLIAAAVATVLGLGALLVSIRNDVSPMAFWCSTGASLKEFFRRFRIFFSTTSDKFESRRMKQFVVPFARLPLSLPLPRASATLAPDRSALRHRHLFPVASAFFLQ